MKRRNRMHETHSFSLQPHTFARIHCVMNPNSSNRRWCRELLCALCLLLNSRRRLYDSQFSVFNLFRLSSHSHTDTIGCRGEQCEQRETENQQKLRFELLSIAISVIVNSRRCCFPSSPSSSTRFIQILLNNFVVRQLKSQSMAPTQMSPGERVVGTVFATATFAFAPRRTATAQSTLITALKPCTMASTMTRKTAWCVMSTN